MLKQIYCMVAVMVAMNAGADFPYHTNTGTFSATTNATGDYNAFSWAWNGYDDQVININLLPDGYSNVYMRMSYPRRGTVYLDLTDGTTTTNNYYAFLSKSNIPPAGVYWTEFVGFANYATSVPTRVLATGKITVQHSTFQNTNQATWVNPLAGTVIGPPFHTLSDLSNWPFLTAAGSDDKSWTNYPSQWASDIQGATQNVSVAEIDPIYIAQSNRYAPRSWVAGFSNAPATWNTDFATIDVALPDGVTGQMFQENHVYGKNDTGAVISNGTVCYIASASGFNCAIVPANATNGYLANLRTIGIATHNIGVGASGKVTTFGNVNEIDTTRLIEGQPIYLDTVTGKTTTNAATYPNANVHLGVCLRSHATQGRIYVSVQSIPHPQDIGAATSTHSQPLSTVTNAGTAAYSNADDFATAAQGLLADTALQVETDPTTTDLLDLAGTRAMTGDSVTLARDVKSSSATSAGAYGAAFGFATEAGERGAAFGDECVAGASGLAFGAYSVAGDMGFAGGHQAFGAGGSFIFSDYNIGPGFYRTNYPNSFSVRAKGGTYFETPNLTVTGTVTATSFIGSGASLTDITAAQVSGALTNNQTGVRLNTMAIHNGFEDQYAQTVAFDPVTRTAICAPTGSTFRVTAGGVTYTSGAVTSSAGPEVSGNMFAYFRASDGAFICTNAAWGIIGGEAQAIYALYDHSNTSTVYVIDERHGVNISDSDHLMRHQTVGSTWASGITLSHYAQDTTAAAGANGTQTVIAVTDSGVFWDEDVRHATLANGTTANSTNTCGTFPIIWKDETTWHRDNGTVFPFFWSGATPQYVNAAGSKTSVPEDNFFVYWLIAVGSSNGTNLFLASHPEVYSTLALAQSGATVANLSSLLGGFPNSELMVCYRLIFNHNAVAPNANPASVKSVKLRAVDDYRNTPGGVILAGTGPSAGSYELTEAKITAAGGLTTNLYALPSSNLLSLVVAGTCSIPYNASAPAWDQQFYLSATQATVIAFDGGWLTNRAQAVVLDLTTSGNQITWDSATVATNLMTLNTNAAVINHMIWTRPVNKTTWAGAGYAW